MHIVSRIGNLGKAIGDYHSVELQTFSLVDCSQSEVWNKNSKHQEQGMTQYSALQELLNDMTYMVSQNTLKERKRKKPDSSYCQRIPQKDQKQQMY